MFLSQIMLDPSSPRPFLSFGPRDGAVENRLQILEVSWYVRCARCHMCVTLYPNLTFNMDMTEDALRAAMTAARSKGDVFSGEEVGT
jgi:hypothetical protein